jgi:Pentapeptide repeats (8 copies)
MDAHEILRRYRAGERVDLGGAWLVGAVLTGADFRRANFDGAFLDFARLQKADLRGATLEGADARGANLTAVKLNDKKLRGATMPDGSTHARAAAASPSGLQKPATRAAPMGFVLQCRGGPQDSRGLRTWPGL